MDDSRRQTNRSLGILFAATIALAVSGVHYHVVGAMVPPMQKAYGWSRGDIAFALTLASFLNPVLNIIVGLLADRYGARAIALPGIVGFAVGTALLGLAGGEIWTWYAAYIAFMILGAGVSGIVYTKLVVEHFTRRRGIALATSLAGAGVLVSTIPMIVLTFEELFGLRGVYPMLALCAFVVMFIPSWLFLPRESANAGPAARHARGPSNWRDVIGSTILWRLALCFLLVGSSVGTFIVHFQPIMADAGLSRAEAATVTLFMGPAMIAGRLGTGLLFDYLPTRLVAACAFSLPVFACIWLWAFPLDFTTASFLAVLIGMGMGAETDVVAYMSSRYFGVRRYGLIFAVLISTYGFALGTSSWVVGKVYDAFGTYDPALLALATGIVVAIMLVISIGRPPAIESEPI